MIDVVQGPNQTALCIVGDFNAKTSDWFPSQPTDSAGRHLQLLAASHQLTQVVNGPTFGICSSSPSLLDLVFLNKPRLLKRCVILPPVSDHCPTLVALQFRGMPKSKPVTY